MNGCWAIFVAVFSVLSGFATGIFALLLSACLQQTAWRSHTFWGRPEGRDSSYRPRLRVIR